MIAKAKDLERGGGALSENALQTLTCRAGAKARETSRHHAV